MRIYTPLLYIHTVCHFVTYPAACNFTPLTPNVKPGRVRVFHQRPPDQSGKEMCNLCWSSQPKCQRRVTTCRKRERLPHTCRTGSR
eukprot:1050693-Prorocentrum_minimum.AAC.1